MLDTNICIYVLKHRPPTLRARFNDEAERLCVSSITLSELRYGAEKSARRTDNRAAIDQFVARLDVLAFTPRAAAHHGELCATLERMGPPAGVYDLLIAAHARSEGLIVVTNNLREFARMPGVRAENWG
jgi:tRNA(fMet)-specific endonuclease VapC